MNPQHWLWLSAVLPALSAASFMPHPSDARRPHLKRKAHSIKDSSRYPTETYPSGSAHASTRHDSHLLHYGVSNHHSSAEMEAQQEGEGTRSMISAGKKEDAQTNGEEVHVGVIPSLSQLPNGSSSSAAAGTILALASVPSSSPTESGSKSFSVSESSQSQSQRKEQAASSSSSSPSAVTSSTSSSSSPFPSALLAFILIPVCLFLLVMAFAFYRIYGRANTRAPLASPLFLGNSTNLGSRYHRDEAITLREPTMKAKVSVLNATTGGSRVETGPLHDGTGFKTNTLEDRRASHLPKLPPPTHSTGPDHHSPRSRVLRPYVPRPYHRPHSAYTADPESIMPLMARTGPANGGRHRTSNKGDGEQSSTNAKGKGKENIPQGKVQHNKRRKDNIPTAVLDISSRSSPLNDPLSQGLLSETYARTTTTSQRMPPSGAGLMHDEDRLVTPPLPSTNTSLEIGLAMLKDFSSPSVGFGLDLSPRPPPDTEISRTAKGTGSVSLAGIGRERAPPDLEQSTSSGSEGLAYLTSGSSRESMLKLPDRRDEFMEDELDVASALAVYRVQHAGDRLKAQNDARNREPKPWNTELASQESSSETSESSCEPRHTPSSFQALTLPTLSEMAFSRADPLYESVTNELFSSYGMRISTANGTGRTSRVSARLSRMLSWFGDPASDAGNRKSGEGENFIGEGGERLTSANAECGVQPLRIGKLRKGAA